MNAIEKKTLNQEAVLVNPDRKHLLVIDDDPTFRLMMERAAAVCGFAVTSCGRIEELRDQTLPSSFDVVVVDYFLDDFKDYINGTDIARALGPVPVILVSASEQCVEKGEAWPASIRIFMHKQDGVGAISEMARTLSLTQFRKEAK